MGEVGGGIAHLGGRPRQVVQRLSAGGLRGGRMRAGAGATATQALRRVCDGQNGDREGAKGRGRSEMLTATQPRHPRALFKY